jgi:TonB family protein
MPNPLTNDTKSEVPQAPPKPKPVKAQKIEKISPKAVPLKIKETKRLTDVASEKQRFRPFKELDPSQVFATQAPQVSNPMFSAAPGSGRIGAANTTLGTRFAAYGQQIEQILARNWNTTDVDARLVTAPIAIVRFEIQRDGSVRDLRVLQSSRNSSLDYSVTRAVQDSHFPPLPPAFDRDSASVEFTFELKRQ